MKIGWEDETELTSESQPVPEALHIGERNSTDDRELRVKY